MLLQRLMSQASPAGPEARLSTLIFHRVLPQPDPLFPDEVDAARFDAICGWLKDWFNVMPLDTAVAALRNGSLPARAMAITFDDGYADNRGQAAPILQRHGLSATFFIATGFLDGGRMWNDTLIEAVRHCMLPTLNLTGLLDGNDRLPLDTLAARRAAIGTLISHAKYLPAEQRQRFVDGVAARAEVLPPADLMLTSTQVRELRAMGMQIGAHTVSHPILCKLPRAQARAEIETSRRVLEGVLDEPVSLFAYPNGKPGEDYSAESVALARDVGFDAAVSTAWGVSTRQTDPFELRRFTPWDRERWRFGLRLWRNLRHGDSH